MCARDLCQCGGRRSDCPDLSSHGKGAGLIDLRDDGETWGPDAVLNGIAYDAKGDRLFVTGKLWPKLFEVRVGR